MPVGWDWASQNHDVTVIDDTGAICTRFAFGHDEASLIEALLGLASLAEPADLPVAIERPDGIIVERLLAAGHPVVPIHPNAFHAARSRWGQNRLTIPSPGGQSYAMGIRYDWTVAEVDELIGRPFHDLLAEAHQVHRASFDPQVVEAAILLSVKTGGCPEDCAYCPQSSRYDTGLEAERLMATADIVAAARNAKASGATRFCMGAAWRAPNDRQVAAVADSVRAVRDLGMETCVTLGMLTPTQADHLAEAGLDFYNHNLDTSPEFYGEVITSRTYDDRLDTLANVRASGVKLCCGGIVGMGESRWDRAGLLVQLAQLDPHPESVPINLLVQVPGTPLHGLAKFDPLELVRTIAAARLMMPESVVRLSAGRSQMTDELQALCLHAGASSVFLGDRLLTTPNPGNDHDRDLLDRLDTRLAVIDGAAELSDHDAADTRLTVSTMAAQMRSTSSSVEM